MIDAAILYKITIHDISHIIFLQTSLMVTVNCVKLLDHIIKHCK